VRASALSRTVCRTSSVKTQDMREKNDILELLSYEARMWEGNACAPTVMYDQDAFWCAEVVNDRDGRLRWSRSSHAGSHVERR
jgi:hypothetical protein